MTPDVKLGGRLFTPVNMEARTVLLDHHLMRVVQQSGCDRLVPATGESSEAYLIRLHNQLLTSGSACDLFGCALLPMGKTEKDWTPEMARETALHVGTCDTEEDRQLVNELAIQIVFGFFKRRLDALRTFLAYSAAAAAEPAANDQSKTAAA